MFATLFISLVSLVITSFLSPSGLESLDNIEFCGDIDFFLDLIVAIISSPFFPTNSECSTSSGSTEFIFFKLKPSLNSSKPIPLIVFIIFGSSFCSCITF
ncbi:hypothetical protein DFH28DRAFT_994031 [Melampsora americana]|nr:hypothetical protein DFH28DRAFT_994031 [Melampsora americana]